MRRILVFVVMGGLLGIVSEYAIAWANKLPINRGHMLTYVVEGAVIMLILALIANSHKYRNCTDHRLNERHKPSS